MNVVQNAEGRYRMSGLAFIVINLGLCVITAGAWVPIAVTDLPRVSRRQHPGAGCGQQQRCASAAISAVSTAARLHAGASAAGRAGAAVAEVNPNRATPLYAAQTESVG